MCQDAHRPEERHDLRHCQILCSGVRVASGLQLVEMFEWCLILEPRGEFEMYSRVVGHELLVHWQSFSWVLFEVIQVLEKAGYFHKYIDESIFVGFCGLGPGNHHPG